jgi:3-methylfumaryl-CoA hydratase
VYGEASQTSDNNADAESGREFVPAGGAWSVDVGPVTLFRFSALTYNSHRLHYDRIYAQTAEGYDGLVVHGPLQVLLMAELARRQASLPSPCNYSYRLTAPLLQGQGLVVSASPVPDGVQTTARDGSGRLTASGLIAAAS